MPAGTSRGQSFIHDPNLSTKKIVSHINFLKIIVICFFLLLSSSIQSYSGLIIQSIGCVKLQFYDEQNNKFIVTRSMEARIQKSKMDFKTMDGTISKVQPDGTVCY